MYSANTGSEKKYGSPTVQLVTAIVIVLMIISMVPQGISGGTITTTLANGETSGSVTFPAGGGSGNVSLEFPAGSEFSSAVIAVEGMPFTTPFSFNHSDTGDFAQSDLHNLEIVNDSVIVEATENWWNNSWFYRVETTVDSTNKTRDRIIVGMDINLSEIMNDLGVDGGLDPDSIRVVEHESDGDLVEFNASQTGDLRYLVPHRATEKVGFDASQNALVHLDWICKGVSGPDTERYYSIYFDTQDRAKEPTPVPLQLADDVILTNGEPHVQNSFIYLSGPQGPDGTADITLWGLGAQKPEVADVNRDGYMDILLPNLGSDPTTNDVDSYLYYGGPNGFAPSADVNFPTMGAMDAAVADVNLDGHLDVVFANYRDGNDFSVNSTMFYGSASGFNSTGDHEFNTTGASGVTIADFDDDGWPDVAFSNYFNGTGMELESGIFMGTASGFSTEPDATVATNASYSCTSDDVDGDGIPDLALTNAVDDSSIYSQNVTIHLGDAADFPGTVDMRIAGNGIYDVALEDLDGDGRTDFVVANQMDGSSFDIDSYVYYWNDSGTYQVPDHRLPTNKTLGTDTGDVNGDGLTDIAFANHESGGSYNINSFVFLGNETGYSRDDRIELPGNGANDVVLADVNRYHITTDSDPPLLELGQAEMLYTSGGQMTSPVFMAPDKIMSVVATWEAHVPEKSGLTVQVSNNGGDDWIETMNGAGTIFPGPGKEMRYRVNMTPENGSPVLHWIHLTYVVGGYPTGLTMDIGMDGSIEWERNGTFNNTTYLSMPVIRETLEEVCSSTGVEPWEWVQVPIGFNSTSSGTVNIFGLNITSNAPPFVNRTMPEIEFPEDGALPIGLVLDDYFEDPDGDILSYSYSGNDHVEVIINDGGTVGFASEAEWSGIENLTFTADDGSGGTASTNVTVKVRSVDDPPVAVIDYHPHNTSSYEDIRFDASNSTDVDGEIVLFLWDFGDGNVARGPQVVHHYRDGNRGYVVNLTLMDDGGNEVTSSVTVSVDNLPPVVELRIGDNTEEGFDTNVNVLIDMSGTMDMDGDIDRFVLDFGDGEMLRMDGPPPTVWQHTYRDGTYEYEIVLTVWDDENTTGIARELIQINNVGPRIVTVTAPSSVEKGKKVHFGVVTSDPDGGIALYQWDFNGDGEYKWSSEKTGNATYRFLKTGTYHATLKVTDDDGGASYHTVRIEVTEATDTVLEGGLAIGLIIGLVVLVLLLGFLILRQKGTMRRQKQLLLRRDRILKELKEEPTGTMGEERAMTTLPRARDKEREVIDGFEEVGDDEVGSREPSTPRRIPARGPAGLGEMLGAAQSEDEEGEEPREGEAEEDMAPEAEEDMAPEAEEDMAPEAEEDMAPEAEEDMGEDTEEGTAEEAEEETEGRKVLARARCPSCKNVIPLYSLEKPMRIKCDECGKEGVIR